MPIGPVKEIEDALTSGFALLVALVLAELKQAAGRTNERCKNCFEAGPARGMLVAARQRSLQQFCMACI